VPALGSLVEDRTPKRSLTKLIGANLGTRTTPKLLREKDKEQAAPQPGPGELSKAPAGIHDLFPQALTHNHFITIIAFYSLGCKSIPARNRLSVQ